MGLTLEEFFLSLEITYDGNSFEIIRIRVKNYSIYLGSAKFSAIYVRGGLVFKKFITWEDTQHYSTSN